MISIIKLFMIFLFAFGLLYLLMFISKVISYYIERKIFKKKNSASQSRSAQNSQEGVDSPIIEITDYEIKSDNSSEDKSH